MHEEVIKRLVRTGFAGLKLSAKVVKGPFERRAQRVDGKAVWVSVRSERIVFTGGKFGEASIDASCSDEARILAHWDGYCQANELQTTPSVGQTVMFPSKSAINGMRMGRVVSVGPRRAVIAFRYNYGRKSKASVPFTSLVF